MTSAIVMATYNGSKYIVPQLESIRVQTKGPAEVIIQDDCSTDGTFQLVKQYIHDKGLNDSWKVYENESNLGYSLNFHEAVLRASSDMVFFADQDDVWDSHKIEIMEKKMKDDNVNVLGCRHKDFADNDSMGKELRIGKKRNFSVRTVSVLDIMRGWHWPGMCMCTKRKWYIENITGNEISNVPHDLLMAILAADKNSFYECDYVGCYHRIHETNTSASDKGILRLSSPEYKIKNYQSEVNSLMDILENNQYNLSLHTKEILNKKIDYMNNRIRVAKENRMSLAFQTYFSADKDVRRITSLANDIIGIIKRNP